MRLTIAEPTSKWRSYTYLEQLSLYEQLLGKLVVNKSTRSPLRKDEHPSFCVYKSKKSDNLYWKDFATGERGNVNDLMRLLNKEVMPTKWKKKMPDTTSPMVHCTLREFTDNDYAYWGSYFIQPNTLTEYGVHAVHEVYTNGMRTWLSTEKNPIYMYAIGESGFKIYRPKAGKLSKWFSSSLMKDLQGANNLTHSTNTLVITKSLKDCMVLHELGYDAVAPSSETSFLTKAQFNYYSMLYDTMYLLYDNDKTGIEQSAKICETFKAIRPIFVPKIKGVKDISDYIKNVGKDKVLNYLHNTILCE